MVAKQSRCEENTIVGNYFFIFYDMPHFVRRDIFAFAKVILWLRHSDILFAINTRRANITRLKAVYHCEAIELAVRRIELKKSLAIASAFFWLGWQDSTRQALSLSTIYMSLLLRKRWTIGSNPAEQSKQKNNRHSFVSVIFWLGWQDSNLRMQQSKCCVLPLDDTPILSLLFILIIPKYSNIIKHFNIPKYSNIPKSYLIVKTPPNLIDRRS